MTRRARKTAAELMAELEADAAFRARRDERQDAHDREVDANRVEERGVLDRVRDGAGVDVASLAELREHSGPDVAAVLLDVLPSVERLDVQRAVIAAVPAEWVGPDGARVLLDLFDGAADGPEGDGLRWSIASALIEMARSAGAAELLVRLRDRSNGQARQMLALAVGATGDPSAVPELVSLLRDDEVNGHVVKALVELDAVDARPQIAELSGDRRGWVRDEVRTALRRLSAS